MSTGFTLFMAYNEINRTPNDSLRRDLLRRWLRRAKNRNYPAAERYLSMDLAGTFERLGQPNKAVDLLKAERRRAGRSRDRAYVRMVDRDLAAVISRATEGYRPIGTKLK